MSGKFCIFAADYKHSDLDMMCNTYKYIANPTLRLGGKVAPVNGTAYFSVFASVDLII